MILFPPHDLKAQLCSMIDTFRHQGMRKKLVETIRKKGVHDERVLKAIEKVPRHLFLGDNVFDERAYIDEAFPIGEGQTISQPFTVAYQTSLLQLVKGERVLEIGTGSGYQAAVLAEMGVNVFTIERNKTLYQRTAALVRQLGYVRIKTFFGDGYAGLPTYAPFEKILVTAGAPEIPDLLIEQLAVNGLMVIPVGGGSVQKMIRIFKSADGSLDEEKLQDFRFVPLLPGTS